MGAIYNAVADLDELVLAVNSRTLAALEKRADGGHGVAGHGPDWAIEPAGASWRWPISNSPAAHRRQWQALFDHRLAAGANAAGLVLSAICERLFGYVEQPVAELQPDAPPARRALLARSLFSAVHGLVALGLEEKLQFIPLPALREQVTTIVTALGYGLAGGD